MALLDNMPLDAVRGNLPFTVRASAALTATANSSDITNVGWRGVRLFMDITVWDATTLDVKVQVKDDVGADYHDLTGAAFAQKSGTGNDYLTIYPGIGETANEAVSDILGRTWRLVFTLVGTSATFSVSGVMLI